MACCKPWLRTISKHGSNRVVSIPCGYCLNCRTDRLNQWSDRCKYALTKSQVGAFVTFTYDDISVPMVRSLEDGSMVGNLNFRDFQNFVKRLRSYIDYHNINNIMCQRDFKYLAVGEYGHHGKVFDRPHFHCLFFGLDFQFCKKMFFDCWQNGFIDVLPILDGGINYVLKYMDKDVGKNAYEQYTKKGLNKPRQLQSTGLGSGLFIDRVCDSVDGYMSYNCGNHRTRPLPMYYKNKLIDKDYKIDYTPQVVDEMKARHLKDYSSKARANYQKRKAITHERYLFARAVSNGEFPIDYSSMYYGTPRTERVMSDECLAWSASEYVIFLTNLNDVREVALNVMYNNDKDYVPF